MSTRTGRFFTWLILPAVIFSAVLLSCCRSDEITLGIIADLTGDNADLGRAGRNGAIIAVDEANRSGGVSGRMVNLVFRDDANEPGMAAIAAGELVEAGVDAIIGPYTSTLVEAAMAVAGPEKTVVFTPTASASDFTGRDDYLFRLGNSTIGNAGCYAGFLRDRRGARTVAIAYDNHNPKFSASWYDAFIDRFVGGGGQITALAPFDSTVSDDFSSLVGQLIQEDPDAVVLVANSADASRITRQIRIENPAIPVLAAEWAGTRQLIDQGGNAVEGMEFLQQYDKWGTQEAYMDFVEEYRRRFGSDPGYSSVLTYETVRVLLQAIENRERGEDLKDSIVANSPYQGLQQVLEIDRYGDCRRESHFVVIRNREFEKAP